ncbi:glycosyltransferase 87 family protein [Desertivirga xinjiangensis]|uniref:glycosyltransferase 87 family protein n=1 Tax=Desertivirga xinjiangensis TaxID=539206 RepID=UPI00210C8150|nr:glycosyltransferase 87 family protein [Pedobacter xinjiangensis]
MKLPSSLEISNFIRFNLFNPFFYKDKISSAVDNPEQFKKAIWIAVLLRFMWFFFIGHSDLEIYKYWMIFLKDLPIFSSYNIPTYAEFDVLPLTAIILKIVTSIIELIPNGINIPGFAYTGIRFANLLIEAGCIYLLHKELKNPFITFFLLFNPASILDGYLWGQMDVTYTLLFVLSLVYFLGRKPLLSGLFIGLSIAFKTQTLLFLPLFGLIILIRKENWASFFRLVSVALIITSTLYLPFMLGGKEFWAPVMVSFTAYGRYDFISVNALNIWWGMFAQYDLQFPDNHALVFGLISRRHFALSCFAVVYSLILIKTLKIKLNNENIFRLFSILCFSYFMLLPEMHERYLYPFFIFYVFVLRKDKTWYVLFWLVNAFYAFNLLYGGWLAWSGLRTITFFNISIVASYVIFLVWMYYIFTEMRVLKTSSQLKNQE